jgi:hypothetical protein
VVGPLKGPFFILCQQTLKQDIWYKTKNSTNHQNKGDIKSDEKTIKKFIKINSNG